MLTRKALLLPLLASVIATTPIGAQEIPDHADFTGILADIVRTPRVDYAALQGRLADLDAYLDQLHATDLDALKTAPGDVQLAFWINAYNACMLDRVAAHYPIRKNAGLVGSIRNALTDRPDNSVWQIRDVFTGAFCDVAGATRSLDEIEHEIIRPMGEPRIHFAINCAALSCPPLAADAYVAERLEEQLDRAVRVFVANPEHFVIDRSGMGSLTLNRVLDWFGDDFGGRENLPGFFAHYVTEEDARLLAGSGVEVRFFEYDWTLNDLDP